MAKQRYVNTKFWDDNYISNLDPSEKLVFLYFLTCPATNISGVYEIPLKKIAVDTGFDKEMIVKIVSRFEKDNKIKYLNGWVAIKNFIKHQESGSPKVKLGIESELKKAPEELKMFINSQIYPIDTISNLNLNLNSNINSNSNLIESTEQEPVTETEISFSKKKAYYNSKLLQTGLSQSDINQCIFEDAKERKQHSVLLNRLGEDYEQFFNAAFSDKWRIDQGALPSLLISQYSKIMAQSKRSRAAPQSPEDKRAEFDRLCREAGV